MRRRPLTRMEREDRWRDLGAAAFVAGVVVLVYWLVPPEAVAVISSASVSGRTVPAA